LSILLAPKQLIKEGKHGSDADSVSENSEGCNQKDKSLCADNALKFCQKWSKSVEVLYKNMNGHQILTKVHFHYNPEVLQ
jgi:hypothetical protein